MTPERLLVLVRTREQRVARQLSAVTAARADVAAAEAALAALRRREAGLDAERGKLQADLQRELAGGGVTVARYAGILDRSALLSQRKELLLAETAAACDRVAAAGQRLAQCVRDYRLAQQRVDRISQLRHIALTRIERRHLIQDERATEEITAAAQARRIDT